MKAKQREAALRDYRIYRLPNVLIINIYRLLQVINRQIASVIEYYRLINLVFDDRFEMSRFNPRIMTELSDQ